MNEAPSLAGFVHRHVAGGPRALLLLHGTGGDENDLLPLGRVLDPEATMISPRGQVLENGMPRFFRRVSEGVFDLQDLRLRAAALADFIVAARRMHGIEPDDLVAVGFSNGANVAAAVMLLRPEVLRAAILLRPMVPLEPGRPPDLRRARVWIGAGRTDPIVPPDQPERLAALLRGAGAGVTLRWDDGGHSIGVAEVSCARRWLVETQHQ